MPQKKIIDLQVILAGKWDDGVRPKDLYANHIRNAPESNVAAIVKGLTSNDRKVQNGCAELASLLSEEHPQLLYPYVAMFIGNINAKEKILRWEAVCTLGHMASVDVKNAIVPYLPRIIVHMRDKSIVLAGHAVRALSRMALAYPEKSRDIFNAYLEAADAFPGNKIGFVIEAMEPLIGLNTLSSDIKSFVQPYKDSPVKVVAQKAARVLKKL
ncbi:MAG: hypothetical protein JXX14_01340 [Deltaproteobacteria bacterium]|nr:hypothetical protein [Deltaproteobacteria bacterium]